MELAGIEPCEFEIEMALRELRFFCLLLHGGSQLLYRWNEREYGGQTQTECEVN